MLTAVFMDVAAGKDVFVLAAWLAWLFRTVFEF